MSARSAERTQFLHDTMITALEGGVNYWSVASKITRHTDPDLFYASFVLHCSDGGLEPVECGIEPNDICTGHKVTPDTVARGLMRFYAAAIPPHVALADRTNGDDGDIDAFDADAIVQYGIFGDCVYG